MGEQQLPMFGGDWTEQKLDMLRQYLKAYVNVMKKNRDRFELMYIDGLAGAGSRENLIQTGDTPLFSAQQDEEAEESAGFAVGSTRIAVQIRPSFDRYIFIEKSPRFFRKLEGLREEHQDLTDRIELRNEDCNAALQELCKTTNWRNRRAVMFLDPFGMQVDWQTIKAVAETQAIDTWILFPISAINRLLRKDGVLPDSWVSCLNRVLGTSEWINRFYREDKSLIDGQTHMTKTCNVEQISKFVNERLTSIFAGVAENPKTFVNSRGNPLFLFCFAISNPSPPAKKIALRIAQHILKGN